jgi:chemotaxis protein MotB
MNVAEPIIIVKKKKHGHGGHHGGAWKVAYADFVTAMMALFIVLWLMTASQDVQKDVAGYFRDPKGFGKQLGSSMSGNGESLTISKDKMDLLKGKIEQAMKQSPDFSKIKNNIEMTVTGEGLRIELLENEKGLFFENGRPFPTDEGKDLLIRLAKEVGQLANPLLVEGHTDAQPFQNPDYSNWELSADRANVARRIMGENGLRPNQVQQVRGFADQHLRLINDPANPRNRRISIIIQFPQAVPETPTANVTRSASLPVTTHAAKH